MSFPLHRNPPFRVEQVGSFLRPDDLLEVRHAWNDGNASDEQLRKAEDKAVNEIVKLQQDYGYHGINDGEYRRHMFWGEFWPNLEGMKEIKGPDPEIFRRYAPDVAAFFEVCADMFRPLCKTWLSTLGNPVNRLDGNYTDPFFKENFKPAEACICVGKIKYQPAASKAHIKQIQYLQKILPKEEHNNIKLTIPAPNWYHFRYKQGSAYPTDVYKNDDEYFEDVIKVFQTELQVLYDHGLRNIQIDDPNICCKFSLSIFLLLAIY
jgi:methionine synthase II (cobalamin-independent)